MEIKSIALALAKAQGKFQTPKKNRVNPYFKSKYADLAGIIDAIRAPLSENGIGYSQTLGFDPAGKYGLKTSLIHGDSGQALESFYPLTPPSPGAAQKFATDLTYARRYCLSAIVGIEAEEDTDGNEPEPDEDKKPENEPKQAKAAPKPVTQTKQPGPVINPKQKTALPAENELQKKTIPALKEMHGRFLAMMPFRGPDTQNKFNELIEEMKKRGVIPDDPAAPKTDGEFWDEQRNAP